jgi:argininosuccinate lyase
MAKLLGEISFNRERLKAATEKGFLVATDMADYLVVKGMTFREAHEIVGKLVLYALDKGMELHEISLDEMRTFARKIDQDVYEWLDPELSIKRKNIPGGTGHDTVRESINRAKEELKV